MSNQISMIHRQSINPEAIALRPFCSSSAHLQSTSSKLHSLTNHNRETGLVLDKHTAVRRCCSDDEQAYTCQETTLVQHNPSEVCSNNDVDKWGRCRCGVSSEGTSSDGHVTRRRGACGRDAED
ncbi:hypothetical protein BLNAU_19086 [Blattamonas nauphoetae]|uniref:Uncharacterized protein n=1 Tax=Blattamonas nauphoetae TaxID=2049346 RepID=A0ABQ9X2J6_9EUKA|nr:hypothetical protein BLNAU_19086 [Blattamonas nauphoetae]